MLPARSTVATLLAVLLLAVAAETHALGGSDSTGCYSYSDTLAPLDANAPTFSFLDIAGTGTQILLGDDQVSTPLPLGFTFHYYGVAYSTVRVSSNGFLTFVDDLASGCCTGQPIPSPSSPNGIVAGWWEDLLPGVAAGTINYDTVGSAPQRVFIAQFGGVNHYPSGTPVTFQFKLFEADDSIEVHYASVATDGGTHSAGIENQTGTIGAQWQLGSALAFTDTAVRYFPGAGLSSDGDGDTVADCVDNCPALANAGQEDVDLDGVGDACDDCFGVGPDDDGDGFCNSADNCPGISNPGQEDADFDGFGDVCDACVGFGDVDSDGDAACDASDNCPDDFNPLQEDADFDGLGDVCDPCIGFGNVDSDGDAVCDTNDNCPDDVNPLQEDADSDGLGDVCDPCGNDPTPFDFDVDGFCSNPLVCPAGCDNCPFTSNADQADGDGDAIGTVCDNCPVDANPDQSDTDFDGFGDVCDACVGLGDVDSDGDAACDASDNCPDDFNPLQDDADSDGYGDVCDFCVGQGTVDSDTDGVCDEVDPCPSDPDLSHPCATLFACTANGLNPSSLFRLNPSTGVGVEVGEMGMGSCSGLAFEPGTAILYAVGGSPNSLFTVDPNTGATTLIGPTGQLRTSDIAFRSDGVLFSYHNRAQAVGTISTATGAATLLSPPGLFRNGNGLTFSADGDLLHADSSNLNVVNQTTGALSALAILSGIPSTCSFPRVNSMDTDESGVVYGVVNCSGIANDFLATIGVPGGTVSAIGFPPPLLDGIAFAPLGACGDGVVNFGENCDDGNTLDGDCCSSTCQAEAAGAPCTGDGSACTIDTCDGAGTCNSTRPIGCKAARRAVLALQTNDRASRDSLFFRWYGGDPVDLAEIADPISTSDYTLCIYTGPLFTPLAEVTVPAAGGRWRARSRRGYVYRDGGGAVNGVTKLWLRAGETDKAKAVLRAKGGALPLPPFSYLPLPVTAQLVNLETGACLETTYTLPEVKKNDAGRFKALGD